MQHYLWCYVTLLYHEIIYSLQLLHNIHITQHMHLIHQCQQIFVTILQIHHMHTLQHTAIAHIFINTINHWRDVSATSYPFHIIYLSHLVSVATFAHHALRHNIPAAYIHYTIYQLHEKHTHCIMVQLLDCTAVSLHRLFHCTHLWHWYMVSWVCSVLDI